MFTSLNCFVQQATSRVVGHVDVDTMFYQCARNALLTSAQRKV